MKSSHHHHHQNQASGINKKKTGVDIHLIYLQHPLRTNHIARTNLAGSPSRASRPHRDRERLERALRAVVVVLAVRAPDVQRDAGGLREALQSVRDHLGGEGADPLAAEAQVDDGVGAVGEVDDGPREGLVEGGVAAAEAGQGGARAQGLGECGAEGEEGVFGGVVVVDFWSFIC